MDFRKAFDSVSHEIFVKKVEYNFGTTGVLLDWIKDNLSGRMQFTFSFFFLFFFFKGSKFA